MKEIKLPKILNIENLENYKAHCAVWNGSNHPLDVFARDREEWHSWNSYKGQKNEFNRKYIFSLMSFYPEENTWLFGGIYKVLSIKNDRYKIRLDDKASEFTGRLKLRFILPGRNRRIKLENYYSDFIVTEILKEQYSGQAFSGYEDIDLTFEQVEVILKNEKPDWRGALQNIKGVYLITDNLNGKKYVGSAYGENGIWSRWKCYVETGHGGNDELTKLIQEKGISYARQHFKFTLLEYRPTKVDDQNIIDRETFWKKALLTRGDFGYNKN